MKIVIDEIWGQIYVLPTIKITHDRMLNGKHELILGWFKYQLVFMW
jgi:hypothetical protein